MILTILTASWLAMAGTTETGGTGLLTLPSIETLNTGTTAVSGGVKVGRSEADMVSSALPLGMASGVGKRTEFGLRAQLDAWKPLPNNHETSGDLGTFVKRRLRDPKGGGLGWGLLLEADGLQHYPAARAGIIGEVLWKQTTGVAASGIQFGSHRDPGIWLAGGAEQILTRELAIASETRLAVSPKGLAEFSLRAGGRAEVFESIWLAGWLGGGTYESAPWIAGGLYLNLYTRPPRDSDTDGDKLRDLDDRCRWDAEDFDGWEDTDGCPDPDNDEDGIPDAKDPTPNGEAPVEEVTRPEFEATTPLLKMIERPRKPPGPTNADQRTSTGGEK